MIVAKGLWLPNKFYISVLVLENCDSNLSTWIISFSIAIDDLDFVNYLSKVMLHTHKYKQKLPLIIQLH